MFIGHYAPAFVAAGMLAKQKNVSAPASHTAWLGVMFIAAQLVDYGFFGLVLAGVEHMRITPGISVMVAFDLYDMPFTHSLLGTVVWGLGFGAAILLIAKKRLAALLGFAVVLSHWFLDLLVHVPDLTLAGSPPKMGLGLWNHPWIAMPLELGIIAASVVYYLRTSAPLTNRAGLAATILILLLLLVQAVNWFGAEPERFDPSQAWSAVIAFTVIAGAAHWTARQRTA